MLKALICPKDEAPGCLGCEDDCNQLIADQNKAMCNRKKDCRKNCVCKPGLVREADGKCVHPRKCPKQDQTCPLNEHLDQCGHKCENQCNQPKHSRFCKDTTCRGSTLECTCDFGFVRHPNLTCVAEKQCPVDIYKQHKVCPVNEHYNNCGNQCEIYCESDSQTCPRHCRGPGACVCNKGFERAPRGDCVPSEQCSATPPPAPSPNTTTATTEPPAPSPNTTTVTESTTTFTTETTTIVTTETPTTFTTEAPTTVTTENATTVTTEKPPHQPCGKHEYWDLCGNACEGKCTDPEHQRMCVEECGTPACACDKHYFRNAEGVCVTKSQCAETPTTSTTPSTTTESPTSTTTHPTCFGEHEAWDQEGCEEVCGGDYGDYQWCSHEAQCVCEPGYSRSVDHICVPSDDCPTTTASTTTTTEPSTTTPPCAPREHWDNFGCEDICIGHNATKHDCTYDGKCVCDDGYALEKEFYECVPRNQCTGKNVTTTTRSTTKLTTTQPCPDNEVWDEDGCEEKCEEDYWYYQYPDPKCSHVAQCVCEPGYARDENGVCVSSDECGTTSTSTTTTSEPSTTISACPDGHQHWSTVGCESHCIAVDKTEYECSHVEQCVCDSGYARNEFYDCVPPSECTGPPPTTTKSTTTASTTEPCSANEIWDDTGCDEACNGSINCTGTARCVCEHDYVRNEDGVCVLSYECPRTTTSTEPSTTTQTTTSPITTTPVCYDHEIWDTTGCDEACGGNISCTQTPRCVCEFSYARDEENFCIPVAECPRQSTTTQSSTTTSPISTTTEACPANEIWDEYGCEHTCSEPHFNTCTGHARCVCDADYLRDENGECVPKGECSNTTTSTSTSTTTHTERPHVCKEIYRPGCEATCDDHKCHGFHIRTCQKGCYRDAAGKCVHLNQCKPETTTSSVPTTTPPPKNCRIEPFGGCEIDCNGAKNCSWISNVCLCYEGYYRAEDGLCVLRDQCLNHTIPPQEGKNCKFDNVSVAHCEYDCYGHRYCTARPGCFCLDGYVRADDKMCVTHEECGDHFTPDPFRTTTTAPTPTTSDPHCEFSIVGECEFDCYGHRHCYETSGCYCREGYVRADDRLCVAHDACDNHTTSSTTTSTTTTMSTPPKPRKNETGIIPSGCETWCDGYEYCSSNESFCKAGYRRDEYGDGRCYLPKDCPPSNITTTTTSTTSTSSTTMTTPSNTTIDPEHFCDEDLCCEWNCEGTYPCSRDPHEVCDYRYARNSSIGECVLIKKCSGPTNRSGCEKHCNKPGCVEHSDPAFICPDGQERHPNGLCVWPKYCPHQNTSTTEPTSTTTESTTTSETTSATTTKPHDHFCNETQCCEWTCDGEYLCVRDQGVVCNHGYARNSSIFECVPIKECSGPQYRTGCEKHCNKPGCVEHSDPAWICPDGQERHSNGLCVWPKYCPHVNTSTSTSTTTEPTTTSETPSTTTNKPHDHFCDEAQCCEWNCDGTYPCSRDPHEVCDYRYARNSSIDECVLIKECSGPEYRIGCEKHCNKPGCVEHSDPVWICPDGQERHSNGLCVWPKYCPHENTSTTESPTTSETTITTPKQRWHTCEEEEELCCEWTCDGKYPCYKERRQLCNNHFYRNESTDQCETLAECNGEVFEAGCEKQCNKPGCVERVEPAQICPPWKARHPSGQCVWPKYCPHENTSTSTESTTTSTTTTTTESTNTTTESPTTSETTSTTPEQRWHTCEEEENLCCEWTCDGKYPCYKERRQLCNNHFYRNESTDQCETLAECNGEVFEAGCEKQCNKPGCVEHVEPAQICPPWKARHPSGQCVWPKYCPHENTSTSTSTTTEFTTTSETTSATTPGNGTGPHEHKRYGCENICGSYACVPHLPPNPLVSICDEGYYRNKEDDRCVLLSDCPNAPTTSAPGHNTTTLTTTEPTSTATESSTSATSESTTSASTPITSTSMTPNRNEICEDGGCESVCHNDTQHCKNTHWCRCQADYYRAEDGFCVKESECDDHTTTTGTPTVPSTTTSGTTAGTTTTGTTASESTTPESTTLPSTKPTTTETTTSPSTTAETTTTAAVTTTTESSTSQSTSTATSTTTSSATTTAATHESYRYGCEKICSDPYDCIPHLPGTTRALEVKICDETYYRRSDGKCVKREECDEAESSTTESATPQSSSLSTPTSSDPSNATDPEPPTTPQPSSLSTPTSSDPSNATDPEPSTTTKPQKCGKNEIPVAFGRDERCDGNAETVFNCMCDYGFVRYNGSCIMKKDCPKNATTVHTTTSATTLPSKPTTTSGGGGNCTQVNEEWSCAGELACSDPYLIDGHNTFKCKETDPYKCYCKKNFARHRTGECVHPIQCHE